MKRWLARHVFYPAQDAIQGRHSLRQAATLQKSQFWSLDQLRGFQKQKLARLLGHARSIPFYERRFSESGLIPHPANPLDALKAIPILTKNEIRTYREQMVADHYQDRMLANCTSGSTGSPLIFSVSPERCQSDVAARIRAHRWFDLEPGDPAIYLWGSRVELDRQDYFRGFRDWLINEKLLNAFEMSNDQLHRYADQFFRIRPYYVYSYASSLWRFAQYVREHRPELKGSIRRVAFTTGEQLWPAWREEIILALECSVAEEYGAREVGLIAHQCPEGAYHLMAENIIMEVTDDAGQSLSDGQEGNLIFTSLESFGMPFIRYASGDRGAILAESCSCGVTLPIISRPTGRSFEFLETNDGTKVTGVSLSRDLKEVEGIAHYRVIQETRNRVRIFLVTNFRYPGRQGEYEIERRVHARIGPATEVIFEYVDQLPPHPSGKYRYVINAIGASGELAREC